MSILAIKFDNQAVDVSFTKTSLPVVSADGRELSAPLKWFVRFREANQLECNNWRLIVHGIVVDWPIIDKDIGIRTPMHSSD
jgi:hypothetical protein